MCLAVNRRGDSVVLGSRDSEMVDWQEKGPKVGSAKMTTDESLFLFERGIFSSACDSSLTDDRLALFLSIPLSLPEVENNGVSGHDDKVKDCFNVSARPVDAQRTLKK